MTNETIILDKSHFDCCSLVATEHIANSLGDPIELPPAIQESLNGEEAEANLLLLFHLMKGCEYELVLRDNTYNHESDLDQFFIYSIFAPVGSSDWIWQRDCFVLIEMGCPDDPRYVEYRTAQVYDLGDDQLGDSGFFDWMLGWYPRYIENGSISDDTDSFLETIQDRTSVGYSSNPTYELSKLCEGSPEWDDNLQGYVGKVSGSEDPIVFFPEAPYYS